jgi:hypothetical protein
VGLELVQGTSALDVEDVLVGPEGRATSNPLVIERQ